MTTDLIDLAATTSRLVSESAIHCTFRSDIQHDLWRQLAILAETQLRAEGIWWSERRLAVNNRTRYAGSDAVVETIHFQTMRVLREIIPAQTERVVELLELEELKSMRAGKTITSLHLEASDEVAACIQRVLVSFAADVAQIIPGVLTIETTWHPSWRNM